MLAVEEEDAEVKAAGTGRRKTQMPVALAQVAKGCSDFNFLPAHGFSELNR